MVGAALADGSLHVAEAAYHQVLTALRDPSGVFADPTTAVGLVLFGHRTWSGSAPWTTGS